MKVAELIALIETAPRDAMCVVAESGGDDDHPVLSGVMGIALSRDGTEVELCMNDECPAGLKSVCLVCQRGCRLIWLVQKPGGPAWIENDELRSPSDIKNRFEFVDARHPYKWIDDQAPLPSYDA